MRNLLVYPVTTTEIIECLEREQQRALDTGCVGGMTPSLLGSAATIVRRDAETTTALSQIVAAMRNSAEPVPDRFISMLEAAIPRTCELGFPK